LNNNKSKTDNTASRLQGQYIEFLQKQAVKGDICRWYVKRTERYTQAYPDQKLPLIHLAQSPVPGKLGQEYQAKKRAIHSSYRCYTETVYYDQCAMSR